MTLTLAVILSRKKTKFLTTPNSKKVFTNKRDIDGQPETVMWLSKSEVLMSPTVLQISLQFRQQTRGFRPGRAQKVSTSDCNIERQPEIAIWLPKPEIVLPVELQQIASKFQRQDWGFRPWQARIKCCQVIATMTDNRKWQCGRQNRKYLYLWKHDNNLANLISSSLSSKIPNLALEFQRYLS